MPRQLYGKPADFPGFDIPSPAVEDVLRGKLGQESEMPGPESLGTFGERGGRLTGAGEHQEALEAGELDWSPVSDAQAQRWMEEQVIHDAPYKLETLVSESRIHRQNLIDIHYGGVDPSLRNTEKAGKELANLEKKSIRKQLMEYFDTFDIEEFTSQQKLDLVTAELQAVRDAKSTVQKQKQDDIATLAQAVGEFNAGQKAKMADIQQQAAGLQEKHAVEAEVRQEVEQEEIKAAADIEQERIKAAADIKEAEIKAKIPPKITGGLTEASIIKSIDDLATETGADPAKAYSNYLEYRKTLGREEAFNKVRQEMMETSELPEGLTEEHIKTYEQNHGWTREETIRKFKASRAKQ